LGSVYWYLSSPLGLEEFKPNKLKQKAKCVEKFTVNSKKFTVNPKKFTVNPKLIIQKQLSPIIEKFNKALSERTYDLDNNIDNGILPDDSYLDGKEDKYTKFQMLGNILKDPNNVESVVVRDPTNPNKYMLKGVTEVFNFYQQNKSSPGVTVDDYVIGLVDEDDGVNKYLNFEYLHRLVGFAKYEQLHVDDDSSRESYHNKWIQQKQMFFPNDVVRTKPFPNDVVRTKPISISSENYTNNIYKSSNNFGSLEFFEKNDNKILKKAQKLIEMTEKNGKPDLIDFYKNKTYMNYFFDDIYNRTKLLITHGIYSISIIFIPFIIPHIFTNFKENFQKACNHEYTCREKNERQTNNPIMDLILMNQSEPLRWIQKLSIVFVSIGSIYLQVFSNFQNYEIKTEWSYLLYTFGTCIACLYLIYQCLLLMPEHHNDAGIRACVTRVVWGNRENFSIIWSSLATIMMTPISLLLFIYYSLSVPFLYMFANLFFDLNNEEKPDNKLIQFFKITLLILSVSIVIEGVNCLGDYYNGIDYFKHLLITIRYILSYLSIFCVIYYLFNQSKFPKVPIQEATCRENTFNINSLQDEVLQAKVNGGINLWLGALLDALQKGVGIFFEAYTEMRKAVSQLPK
tara:strand:+ start:460 stop:2337 length:1878 start_codon:yes stop_codon:yes gene_type:complete